MLITNDRAQSLNEADKFEQFGGTQGVRVNLNSRSVRGALSLALGRGSEMKRRPHWLKAYDIPLRPGAAGTRG
jgi:hypothetical protein